VAYGKMAYEFDWAGAEAGFQRAVELDPADPRARATLGWALLLMGKAVQGLAELERAVELSENTGCLAQLGEAYGLAGSTWRTRTPASNGMTTRWTASSAPSSNAPARSMV
jgi:predicted Zn-dependent protease